MLPYTLSFILKGNLENSSYCDNIKRNPIKIVPKIPKDTILKFALIFIFVSDQFSIIDEKTKIEVLYIDKPV
jgi:hypothetical protein